MASSGFVQWGNMEPLLPPSCSDPVAGGKLTGIFCRNHMLEVADRGDLSADAQKAALAGMAVFTPWVTKWFYWTRLPKRGFNTPQPALPHQYHPYEHVVLSLQQTGNLPLPLRQQPAGAWINTCTNTHCPAFWWDHSGSVSPLQPPTLAGLNTTALCHLVILGKKRLLTRLGVPALTRAGEGVPGELGVPGTGGSPVFIPHWYNRVGVCWHGEGSTFHEEKQHPLAFSGAMA